MRVCLLCGDPATSSDALIKYSRGREHHAHAACLVDAGFALDGVTGRTPIGEPSCVVAAEFDQVVGPFTMESLHA